MAKVSVHPDPRVQALLEQVREREIAQAIDRLLTWREAVPSRLARAIARADALPLSKAELARVYPDLWPSPEAAKHDLARVEKGAIPQTIASIWGLAPFSGLVAYWRGRSQRKPYRAVVRDGRVARELLEAVVGPVLRVEPASSNPDHQAAVRAAASEQASADEAEVGLARRPPP